MIAQRWFPVEERTIAVTIGTYSNYVGWAVGLLLPALMMNRTNDATIGNSMNTIFLTEAIILCLPLIPGFFIIRDNPEHPPSVSAIIGEKAEHPFWKSLGDILTNWKVMAAMIIFGMGVGFSQSISTMMQTIIPPGYTEIDIGFIGFTFISSGVIGGIGCTLYSQAKAKAKDDQESYDYTIKAFYLIAIVSIALLATIVQMVSVPFVFFLFGLAGLGMIGFVPFAYQSTGEISFPIEETLVMNFLICIAQFFGLLGNFMMTDPLTSKLGLWTLLIFLIPAGIYLLFFYTTIYNRRDMEENQSLAFSVEQEIEEEASEDTAMLVGMHE